MTILNDEQKKAVEKEAENIYNASIFGHTSIDRYDREYLNKARIALFNYEKKQKLSVFKSNTCPQ